MLLFPELCLVLPANRPRDIERYHSSKQSLYFDIVNIVLININEYFSVCKLYLIMNITFIHCYSVRLIFYLYLLIDNC